MSGKPIPSSTASAMINKYVDHVQRLDVDAKKKTQYVSFTLSSFLEWLNQVAPSSDELRICLGIYADDSSEPGRVTTIIWPYKNGKPAAKPIEGKDGGDGSGHDPYNDGHGNP